MAAKESAGISNTGLFKRRNAFWRIDSSRAGSLPDVPETKKLMSAPVPRGERTLDATVSSAGGKGLSEYGRSRLLGWQRSNKESKWAKKDQRSR